MRVEKRKLKPFPSFYAKESSGGADESKSYLEAFVYGQSVADHVAESLYLIGRGRCRCEEFVHVVGHPFVGCAQLLAKFLLFVS